MLAHPIEIAFLVGVLIAIATPWIVLYRYWPVLPERISTRKAKDGSPVYESKRQSLILQGIVTVGIIVLAIVLNPFQFLSASNNPKAVLQARFFESLILWFSLLCAILPCYWLNRVLTGRRSGIVRAAILILLIVGLLGVQLFSYLAKRM